MRTLTVAAAAALHVDVGNRVYGYRFLAVSTTNFSDEQLPRPIFLAIVYCIHRYTDLYHARVLTLHDIPTPEGPSQHKQTRDHLQTCILTHA